MVESELIDNKQATTNDNWQGAMKEELKAIEKRNSWELVKHMGKKAIDLRKFYKRKLIPNGEIFKYKERLVEKEFLQKHGINFNEVYAQVDRLETISLVVSIATYRVWKMCELDVKSTFLNEPLEEEVYVK